MVSSALNSCSAPALHSARTLFTARTFFAAPAVSNPSNRLRVGLQRRMRLLFGALAVALFASSVSLPANAEELPVLPLTVNVNSADARSIANVLQGVGLSRAAAIVAYREQHGAFKSVEDLTSVKGVGNRTLELNSTRILLAE